MKRFISLLLVCVMVIPFGILASLTAVAEETATQAITVPTEPTVAADAPVYYIAHSSWQTYKDGDGSGKDATNPTSSEGWHEGGNMYEKAQGGAIFVIEQKGYVGAARAAIKSDKPILITALDPADNASNIVKVDGEYNTTGTGTGQFGMFIKDTIDTNTDDKNSFFIRSAVIFENTAILQRDDITGIYHVETGGSIVIKDTCDIIYGAKGTEAPKLVVDEGGYAYLHNVGFSSYTGNGTIVLDRALVESGAVTPEMFLNFEGNVVYQNGLPVWDVLLPTEPTVAADAPTYYIAHNGWQTYKDGDGSGKDATNPTSSEGWHEGGNMYEKAQGGAIFVIEQKGYVGADSAAVKSDKPVMFTALDPADNASNIVKVDGEYNTKNSGTGQFGMFMKDTKDTNTDDKNSFFIQSAVIFENTAILQRDDITGIYHVEAGGSIVIKDTCDIIYGSAGTEAPKLVVDAGGYAYLHNVGFSSYTGNGTIVLDSALIESGAATSSMFAGFEGLIVTEDGKLAFDGVIPTEPTVAADAPTYYIAYEGWQTYKDGDKSGKDAENPTASKGWQEGGNMYGLAQGGAIFVIEQKGYVGAATSEIKSDKPVMFTALDPVDGLSNVAKNSDGSYNTAADNTANPTGQFGMFIKDTTAAGDAKKDTLVILSAVIFDNTVILNRKATTPTFRVEAGGAIVINSTVDFAFDISGTENVKLVVDAGGYAYLHNVGFSSYTGNGTIVLDSALIDAGKITAYTFAGFEGKILTEDGRALCKSTGTHNCSLERINYTYFNVCSSCGDRFDPYTEPTLTSSDTFYAAYDYDENKEYLVSGSPALITNSGTTRQSALCTNTGKGNVWGNGTNADPYEGKLYLMAKDGGTIVALGKLHCGANGNVPATTSPILFTAIDPADGTDFTSRDTDGNIVYMTAAGNNSGQYGMFLLEPNKTLTFNGDVIFDEIVMLSRLSASSATNGNVSGTLSVGATGTLVIKDTVQFAHLKGNQNLRLNVEEGGVAILHSAEFHAYTGNGILVLDRALIEAGKITKEQVSGFNGIIMTTDGNEACALTDAHRTVDGSCVNCEKTTVKFENATVTLGGILGLNFYTKLDESILSDANTKMRFTRPDGSVQEVLASNVTPNSSGNYVFSCDVAAKEMTENVKAELVTSDGTVKTYNYTVQKYASYIVNHSTEYNDADVELARTLLNYGATAQLMFNHNTDTLANSTLEETDKTLGDVDTTGITPSAKTGEADGVVCTGTSAVWDSKMKLLYYFRVDEGVTPTFKLDGNIVEATELSDSSWGTHFIEVADIYAKDMVDVHTVEVTVGEQTMTVESSVYAYFRGIILTEGFTEVQKNAAKAGYLYGQAAIAYANSKTGGN